MGTLSLSLTVTISIVLLIVIQLLSPSFWQGIIEIPTIAISGKVFKFKLELPSFFWVANKELPSLKIFQILILGDN